MSAPLDFWKAVGSIRERDNRYDPAAYAFVMEALEFTIHGLGERRHVSGRELLQGMVAFATDRYGVMSFTLLDKWGVIRTDDIGEIVFHLVDEGVLSRQDADTREDFHDVFDLRDALESGYFD